jgi:hypothetical protein
LDIINFFNFNKPFINIEVKNMIQMTQVKQSFNPILLVILGAVFWFEALLFIRFGGETLFVNGNPWLLLLFVAAMPIAWILVKIAAVVGKIDREDLLSAAAIMALTATLLDGIALTLVWAYSSRTFASSRMAIMGCWGHFRDRLLGIP